MRPHAPALAVPLVIVLGSTSGCERCYHPEVYLADLPLERDESLPGASFRDAVEIEDIAALAVGDHGLIVRFSDTALTAVDAGTTADLHGVTSGDRLVIVGAAGTILRSSDGSTWSPAESGVTTDLHDVVRGGTSSFGDPEEWPYLVAVGDDTVLIGDPGGASWAAATGDQAPGPLRQVVATEYVFIAFSATGTAIAIDPVARTFVTSPDTLSAPPIAVWVEESAILHLADGTRWSGTSNDTGWTYAPAEPGYPCEGGFHNLPNDTFLCFVGDDATLMDVPVAIDNFAAATYIGESFLAIFGDDGSLRLHRRVDDKTC